MNKISGAFMISILFASGVACAGVFGPSNFDECVMQQANEAKTVVAVSQVRSACSRKFPKTVPPDEIELASKLVKSGVILSPTQYRYIYNEHYKDMPYEKFINTLYEKNVRPFNPNMTLEDFKQKALP